MKNNESQKKSLESFFKALEQLTKVQRLAICVVSILLVAGSMYYFLIMPKNNEIGRLEDEYSQLETNLAAVKRKAMNLERLEQEMIENEAKFRITMKALPDKKEIPSLLASVSQSGQDAGLDFVQFQPKPEVNRNFFAEIPVTIKVRGDYHNVAVFFDKVSMLNRIVNIKNIKITKSVDKKSKGDALSTECTAVTYRFVESSSSEAGSNQNKKNIKKT